MVEAEDALSQETLKMTPWVVAVAAEAEEAEEAVEVVLEEALARSHSGGPQIQRTNRWTIQGAHRSPWEAAEASG